MSGLVLDVDNYMTMAVHKQNNKQLWADYNQRTGTNGSAMEHLVPEQLFSTEDSPAEGVSAVKALTLAVAEGQKVFTITRDNLDQALANITLATEVEKEIRQGVLAGKTVTAHERNITLNGWNGAGYLIIDPETGAGAYKISGGVNGGFISDDVTGFLTFVGLSFGLIGGIFALPLLNIISAVTSILLAVNLYLDYSALNTKCVDLKFIVALSILAAVVAIFVAPVAALLFSYISFLAGGAVIPAAGSKVCKG